MVNSTDLVLEFLESCIHQVLYSKGVYPVSVFEKRFKYGHQVFQSRHPHINSYIRKVLGNVHPLMDAGLVESVVVVLNKDKEESTENREMPVEHITISCAVKNRVSTNDDDGEDTMITEENRGINKSSEYRVHEASLFELEKHMKNALLDLLKMQKLPEEYTYSWNLHVHTRKSSVGVNPQQDAVLRESLASKQWMVKDDDGEQALPFSDDGDDPRAVHGIGGFSNSIISVNMTSTTFS